MSLLVRADNNLASLANAPTSASNPDGSAAFPIGMISTGTLPPGATQLFDSGYAANSSTAANLNSSVGRTAYLTALFIMGNGATAAATALVTFTGLQGGTKTCGFPVPAGVGLVCNPLAISFPTPLVASGPNVNISISVAAFGSGSIGQSLTAFGYMI